MHLTLEKHSSKRDEISHERGNKVFEDFKQFETDSEEQIYIACLKFLWKWNKP